MGVCFFDEVLNVVPLASTLVPLAEASDVVCDTCKRYLHVWKFKILLKWPCAVSFQLCSGDVLSKSISVWIEIAWPLGSFQRGLLGDPPSSITLVRSNPPAYLAWSSIGCMLPLVSWSVICSREGGSLNQA